MTRRSTSPPSGILHSEKNDAWRAGVGDVDDEPVRLIQMWVVPDERGIQPGYEQLEIADELLRGGLVLVASGMASHAGDAAIRIKNRYAALHAARMQRWWPVSASDQRSTKDALASSPTSACFGAWSRVTSW